VLVSTHSRLPVRATISFMALNLVSDPTQPTTQPTTQPAVQHSALSPAIQALADEGVQRSYRKGAIIVSEGDAGDTLFILLQGSVRTYGTDADGREVTYGTIPAPNYFGEMSLDGGARSASVEALEPCVCAVVTSHRVRDHLARCPDLAFELITKIIARARSATVTARNLALLDAYGRLAAQGKRAIPERTTHADLAQRIGTSREMVSKLLRDLEKGGYVSVDKRSLVLVKKLPAKW
jgi:CRP/FNR family transcriptional regulator, cyclic AMP receptor protein